MKLEKISAEVVKDLIPLVNSLGNLAKTATVKYPKKTKEGKWIEINFDYVPLDDIMARIKESENFAFMQPLGTMADGSPCIQCILIHKSGEVIASDPYKLRVRDGATKQEEGSEITYSRRYSAAAFFGIASDDDNDASDMKPESKKNTSLSDVTRKKLNSQIADYKKLTKASNVTGMLEKEIGKPLSEVTEQDAKKISAILARWTDDFTLEQSIGG